MERLTKYQMAREKLPAQSLQYLLPGIINKKRKSSKIFSKFLTLTDGDKKDEHWRIFNSSCFFTLLRRKPRLLSDAHYGEQARVFRPWVWRVLSFEALKERSRMCFGGFRAPSLKLRKRPDESYVGATGFSSWGSTSEIL